MSAFRNTAAALALGLTGGLALPSGAFADCNTGLASLNDSYNSGRVDVVLGALKGVTSDDSCSSGRVVGAKRQAASVVARFASARVAEGRVDEAEAIILQAPALHWAVQAVRGDIAAKRGNREDAAGFYNSALDLLADPRLTNQTKQLAPIAKRLAGLAQENMMLAGTTESALSRGDAPSGVLRFVARGLAVEKAGAGGADAYKPDDYQEPDKIAVYQPPKKDDIYVAPKKEEGPFAYLHLC